MNHSQPKARSSGWCDVARCRAFCSSGCRGEWSVPRPKWAERVTGVDSHDQLKKCWHRIAITTSEDSAKCKVMPKGNQRNAPGTRKKLWSMGCSSAYVLGWDGDIQVQSKLMALITTQMSQKPHSAAAMTSWWLWCIKITLGWVCWGLTLQTAKALAEPLPPNCTCDCSLCFWCFLLALFLCLELVLQRLLQNLHR